MAVTVVVLVILGLVPWLLARCRRRRREEREARQAARPAFRPNPFPYDDEIHYKRASQIKAFGELLSTGASRPVSDASDGSHTPTHESHHSSAPMIQRNSRTLHPYALPPYSNGYQNYGPNHEKKIFDPPNLPKDVKAYQLEPFNVPRANGLYPQVVNDNIRNQYISRSYDNFPAEQRKDEDDYVAPHSLRTLSPLKPSDPPRPQRQGHEDFRAEASFKSTLPTPPQSGRPIIPPRNPRRLTMNSDRPPVLELPPLPKMFPNPFTNRSQHSVAQSSPSIYPPTLPGEDEDDYWRHQGFENIVISLPGDRPASRRQPTAESSLGLHLGHENSSQTTIRDEHEGEMMQNRYSNVQPENTHRGTTATAVSLPRNVFVSEGQGRYPLLTVKTTRL